MMNPVKIAINGRTVQCDCGGKLFEEDPTEDSVWVFQCIKCKKMTYFGRKSPIKIEEVDENAEIRS